MDLSQVKSHKSLGMTANEMMNKSNNGIAEKFINSIPHSKNAAASIQDIARAAGMSYSKGKGSLLFAIKNLDNLKVIEVGGQKKYWLEV